MGFLQASGHKIFINQSVPSLVLFVSGIYIYIFVLYVFLVCVCVCVFGHDHGMQKFPARDKIHATAVTQATVVIMPDTYPTGPPGNS